MGEGPGGVLKILDDIPIARAQHPLGRKQALHPDRAPSVNASRGDADLRAHAEAYAVSEAGGSVVEHARRVDAAEELLGRVFVLCDDALFWERKGKRREGMAAANIGAKKGM